LDVKGKKRKTRQVRRDRKHTTLPNRHTRPHTTSKPLRPYTPIRDPSLPIRTLSQPLITASYLLKRHPQPQPPQQSRSLSTDPTRPSASGKGMTSCCGVLVFRLPGVPSRSRGAKGEPRGVDPAQLRTPCPILDRTLLAWISRVAARRYGVSGADVRPPKEEFGGLQPSHRRGDEECKGRGI